MSSDRTRSAGEDSTLVATPGDAATISGGEDTTAPISDPAPGSTIGRFRVEHLLGRGGMGVVVEAYDPDLDRRIAVKLLRIKHRDVSRGSEGHERLIREARAMARLVHPNVLTVHEVGTVDGRPFIATELASGGTLRSWLGVQPRGWREVRDRLVDAGRGLAAAHALGLVHRDFKPDNVLRLADGTIKVADFGLVGEVDDAPASGRGFDPLDSGAKTLTVDGALMGTPAYMAPEQLRRSRATAASDQFAFCVTAWEALHGERPFDADTTEQLLAEIEAARPRRRRDDVPAWLDKVLARGLATDPAQRYPSIAALLDAMLDDPGVRRRRRRTRGALIAAAVGLVGVTAGALVLAARSTDGATPCAPDPARFTTAWSDARAAQLRTAFAASGRSYGATTAERTVASLDAYRDAWVAARVTTCQATHVRREQSPALMDQRMRCLDDRRTEVAAVVEILAAASDATVVDSAIKAVGGLTAPASCVDAAPDAVPLPADPAARLEVARLTAAVAQVRALGSTGRNAEAIAGAKSLREPVEATGYAPLRAALLVALGGLEDEAGHYADAEALFDAAAGAAAESRDAALEANIWTRLLLVVAVRQQRFDDADLISRAATSALTRAGQPARGRADLLRIQALVESARGQHERATALIDEAVAMVERDPALHDLLLHRFLQSSASVRIEVGDFPAALAALERAKALIEAAQGDGHPDLGIVLNTIGQIRRAQGDYAGATAAYQRSLEIATAVFGADSLLALTPLGNLGTVYVVEGRYDEAAAIYERVIDGMTKLYGPEAPQLAPALMNLGNVLNETGRFAEAIPYHRRAIALREKLLGPDHADVSWALSGLGHALRNTGELAEARALQLRALDIVERSLGKDHAYTAYALDELTNVELAAKDYDLAVRYAERSLAARVAGPAEPREISTSRFLVAQARYERGKDRAAAVALARQARDELRAMGDSVADDIDDWFRENKLAP